MIKKTIREFETWLYGRVSSDNVYRYLLSVKRVQKRFGELTPNTAIEYVNSLRKQGSRSSYINCEIANLKQWFTFTGEIEKFICPYAKQQETTKTILSQKEIELLINLPRQKGRAIKTHERYSLFWKILAETGMRPKELATLKQKNIRDDGVYLYETKTGRPRFVPLLPETIKRLKEFAEDRDVIFINQLGTPLKKADWGNNFRYRLRILGIKRPGVSAYSLRHSKITRMIEGDISPFKIRKIVGHADIQSTLNYEHLTTRDVITANERDPLFTANLTPDTRSDNLLATIKQLILNGDHYEFKKTEKGIEVKIIWG